MSRPFCSGRSGPISVWIRLFVTTIYPVRSGWINTPPTQHQITRYRGFHRKRHALLNFQRVISTGEPIYMTPKFQIAATPYRQFPLRLPAEMADELDAIAKRTRINKTTISRIALQKFLMEIERSGAAQMLDEVCEL